MKLSSIFCKRWYELCKRGHELSKRWYELSKRGYELSKRWYELSKRGYELPHKPNLLKPPHHQQNQIKLPSLQASHIFLHNVFTSLIFPHQRFPKKTQSAKPLKQQENAAIKNTDPDQLSQNPHSRKKEKIPINKNEQANKQKIHQNPSTLSKNNTQNHREEVILVSEKNNTLITSLPATCNLFLFFSFFLF